MPALAEPLCVGALVNTPFPGAVDVVRRSVDVASARVAGLWQEGRIDGFGYQVFSNRTGRIADDLIRPNWQIEVFCDTADRTCRQDITGSVPDEATAVANRVALCLIGATMEDLTIPEPDIVEEAITPGPIDEPEAVEALEQAIPDFEVPIVETVVVEVPVVETVVIPSCQRPIPNNENEQVRQLQTILQQIGLDPGPVDGLLGPLTVAAMVEAIGSDATSISTQASLIAVRNAHCEN